METSDDSSIGLFLIICLIWIILYAFIVIRKEKNKLAHIEEHKANLLRGGVIPRAPKDVHNAALAKIAKEHVGKQLPRVKFYDPDL